MCDYLGAIVDRQFTFTVHQFRNMSAIVRISYPDLVVDLKAVEVFESVPFLPSPDGGGDTDASRGGLNDEEEVSARKSKYKESDVANVAHIDCVPLRVPLGEQNILP